MTKGQKNNKGSDILLSILTVVCLAIAGFFLAQRGDDEAPKGAAKPAAPSAIPNSKSPESPVAAAPIVAATASDLSDIFADLEDEYEGAELSEKRLTAARTALALAKAEDIPGIYEHLVSTLSEDNLMFLMEDISRAVSSHRNIETLAWLGDLPGTATDIQLVRSIGLATGRMEGMTAFEAVSGFKSEVIKAAYIKGYLSNGAEFGSLGEGFSLLEKNGISGRYAREIQASMISQVMGAGGGREVLDYLGERPPEESKGLASIAVGAWAARSPSDAARYVEEIAGDFEREKQAVPSLVNAWAEHDLEAASAWLVEQRPTIGGWDHSARSLARRLRQNSPEESLVWAAAIRNDKERLEVARTTYRNWARRDQDAATAALGEHLSPEDVETITAPPKEAEAPLPEGVSALDID